MVMDSTRVPVAFDEDGKIHDAEEAVVVGQGSAPRPFCKLCVAKGEDTPSHAGCLLCICKAAALDRLKAAGGQEDMARPPQFVTVADLQNILADGGRILNEEKSMATGRMVVTVRLPDAYTERFRTITPRPRTPPVPLPADHFQKYPSMRQHVIACSLQSLSCVESQENTMAQVYKMGYATVEKEVIDGDY